MNSDFVDGQCSFQINFSTKIATKKETFLHLDFITTYPVVLLRFKINLRHIQEVNISTHTRVIISNKRMNKENISIYEVGTKGRFNWTEVCNSKRESSHVR